MRIFSGYWVEEKGEEIAFSFPFALIQNEGNVDNWEIQCFSTQVSQKDRVSAKRYLCLSWQWDIVEKKKARKRSEDNSVSKRKHGE